MRRSPARGKWAEDRAFEYLARTRGCRLLARNVRVAGGEIDLGAGVQKVRYKGNWKMMAENSLEGGYHGHFLHQYFFEVLRTRGSRERART